MAKRIPDERPRTLSLAEIGPRVFETVEPGVCYRLTAPGAQLSLEVDRLVWQKQELLCELLVRVDFLGTDAVDGVLSLATFNVSSARGRTERANLLEKKSRSVEIPWGPLLEELCQRTLTAERIGEPASRLRDAPNPETEDRILPVFGFKVPRHHPSILFGDGGSMKSYLMLYLGGLMVAEGYRVALFDWEMEQSDHRERYGRLFGDEMPSELFYTRCMRPLVYEADRLKRIVRQQGIDYALYDSVGFACHEKPESSDAPIAYFRAVRQIGVGSMHVAHVSKAEGGDQKPFGSAFFHNSARATWNIKPSEGMGDKVTLGVFDRKDNFNGKQLPFALDVSFEDGRTRFSHGNIADEHEFVSALPFTQRLRNYLKSGARSREEIAQEFTEVKENTRKGTISKALKDKWLVEIPGPSGVRIGLPR